MEFLTNPVRDAIVMGRANVDMYVADPDDSLEGSESFEKSVGGSAANIAVGMARLGRKVEFLGLVSDDPFGRFVESFLETCGIGTRYLGRDHTGTLTSLAFAERRNEESRVLFYRNNASDLAVDIDDVPVEDFRGTAVLVVTGTGLSASPSREATLFAMEAARAAGTKVVIDLDWRDTAWASLRTAGLVYRIASERSDIIIGTRDEFDILLNRIPDVGTMSDEEIAGQILSGPAEFVVIKRGKQGASAFTSGGLSWKTGVFPVEVKKNFGAGDSFAAAVIHGLLSGLEPDEALRWGAGAAALVVGHDSCAASAPTEEELKTFITDHQEVQ